MTRIDQIGYIPTYVIGLCAQLLEDNIHCHRAAGKCKCIDFNSESVDAVP